MNVLLYVPESWMPWIAFAIIILLAIALVELVQMGHK